MLLYIVILAFDRTCLLNCLHEAECNCWHLGRRKSPRKLQNLSLAIQNVRSEYIQGLSIVITQATLRLEQVGESGSRSYQGCFCEDT